MTHDELQQILQELIDLGWIDAFHDDQDLCFSLKRCQKCEGTGLLLDGYCSCKMGRDVQRASRSIRV